MGEVSNFEYDVWKESDWKNDNLSHEKNRPTFQYTGSLIGILIIVYHNHYITA